jgi:hypothetical protein
VLSAGDQGSGDVVNPGGPLILAAQMVTCIVMWLNGRWDVDEEPMAGTKV